MDAGPLNDPNLINLLQNWRDEIVEVPILKKALEKDYSEQGSNWFVVPIDVPARSLVYIDRVRVLDTFGEWKDIERATGGSGPDERWTVYENSPPPSPHEYHEVPARPFR